MSLLDFAVTYFTSQSTVLVLALLYSSLAVVIIAFRFERYPPQRRLRLLFASFGVAISTWSFLASSLLLCVAFIGLYQAGEELAAVRTVFGFALLASLVVALPVSAVVTFKVPRIIAKRLVEELAEPDAAVVDMAKEVARGVGVSMLRMLQSSSGVPFAYSVGGAEGLIVVSKGLVTQLDEDEVETVLAHELAHLKNHDGRLKTLIAVYRRVLFFDPFMRFLEAAIHSEKEFSADEASARGTKKPLSLASALLKISSAQSGGRGFPVKIEGLAILGRGKILRTAGVKERIERLMMLATELQHEEFLGRGGSKPDLLSR
jgi:Zn-dependent protease with chaperone function